MLCSTWDFVCLRWHGVGQLFSLGVIQCTSGDVNGQVILDVLSGAIAELLGRIMLKWLSLSRSWIFFSDFLNGGSTVPLGVRYR